MTLLSRTGLVRMRPRDPDEPHRAASPLELFFDLTFVVGVSVAAARLLHAEEVHSVQGVLLFVFAFFAVWWAWMNFTWFASAFDTDDWLYRVLTFLQMGGVLVLAAGIPRLVDDGEIGITVVGYVMMRLALLAQWLRASRVPEYRTTALRYAGSIVVVQACWALLLLVPQPASFLGVVVLILAECSVPVWAERARVTPFHRRHIAERFGLFTLIVLGEGLLSVTNAIIEAQEAARGTDLLLLGATALVLIAGMWWVYFAREAPVLHAGFGGTFAFGYLHAFVFAAAASLASGIELAIGSLHGEEGAHTAVLQPAVHAATTVPVALFLLTTWFTVLRASLGPAARAAVPVLAVLIGLAALLPFGLQAAAVLVVAVVVLLEADRKGALTFGSAGNRLES